MKGLAKKWGNVVHIPTSALKVERPFKQWIAFFMIFTGTYELSIDPKNRLSIPAGIRSAMDPEKDGSRFYLVPGGRRGTLALYADQYFERYAEHCHASLEENAEKEDFEQVFYAMATLVDIDKQGRVVLPQRILDYAGINKKVTVAGRRDHLVIWNREEFDRFLQDNWNRYPDLLKQARLKTDMKRGNGDRAD
jgi:MraZ protein